MERLSRAAFGAHALEVDALVFAECSVFVVEAKQYTGRLTGDDQGWELGGRSVPSPVRATNNKSRALASLLDDNKAKLNTEPVVVVPDASLLFITGEWAGNAVHLCDLASWLLTHDAEARKKADTPEALRAKMDRAIALVQGRWGERQRSARRRVSTKQRHVGRAQTGNVQHTTCSTHTRVRIPAETACMGNAAHCWSCEYRHVLWTMAHMAHYPP
jgi:hypothetical protein